MPFWRLRSTELTELAIAELIKRQKSWSSVIVRFATFIPRARPYQNRSKPKNNVKIKLDLNIVTQTEIVWI